MPQCMKSGVYFTVRNLANCKSQIVAGTPRCTPRAPVCSMFCVLFLCFKGHLPSVRRCSSGNTRGGRASRSQTLLWLVFCGMIVLLTMGLRRGSGFKTPFGCLTGLGENVSIIYRTQTIGSSVFFWNCTRRTRVTFSNSGSGSSSSSGGCAVERPLTGGGEARRDSSPYTSRATTSCAWRRAYGQREILF